MATNQNTKRKDKARVVLRKGESQRKDGKYDFRWTSPDGKRHSIYAATLEELSGKEKKTSSWIHWKASRQKRGMSP